MGSTLPPMGERFSICSKKVSVHSSEISHFSSNHILCPLEGDP